MIEFSTFYNKYAKYANRQSFSLSIFAQGMTTPVSQDAEKKDDLPLWSPTLFSGNRSKSNAEYASCLVFDVDDGLSDFDQWRNFKTWNVIAHTSFSHTPEHPKYRIILPLEKPIPCADWEKVWRAALELWRFCGCDGEPDLKALKDPARMYYRYALPKEGAEHHQSVFHAGLYDCDFDYSHIELPKPKPPRVRGSGFETVNDAIIDTQVREVIASKLGCSISGNKAHSITCPHCHRDDVYFFIDISNHPSPLKGWKCNHVNSCGGYGNLTELI